VLIQLEAVDVIHDFWVPQLGRKMDAVPGQSNRFWIAADKPGNYLGACAEYCGAQHAWMRLLVVAQTPNDFAAWQQQQAKPIAQASQTAAQKGAQVFAARTCANCHAVNGGDKAPNVGPNLAHLASRTTLGAGIINNTPQELAIWLKNPQAIKPESLMPNLYLTDDEVQALVAYLETN
jgi:cytochrome c oxidase subunit 2